MSKHWKDVKAAIEKDIDRIWFEEPEEVKMSRLGIFPSGAGSHDQVLGNLFFQACDTQAMGWWTVGPAISAALSDDTFSVEHCKRMWKYAGEVEEGGTRRRFHYLFRHVRRDIGAEDHNGKQSARESGRENLFRRKPCFLRLFPRSHRQRAFRKARRDYLRRNGCRGGERR